MAQSFESNDELFSTLMLQIHGVAYRILPIVGESEFIEARLIEEDRVIFQKLLVSKGSTYLLVIHHLIVGRS